MGRLVPEKNRDERFHRKIYNHRQFFELRFMCNRIKHRFCSKKNWFITEIESIGVSR